MSNSRYQSKYVVEEAVSVVSFIFNSWGYIIGISKVWERTSSIYLKLKLDNLASLIFLFLTSVSRNSDSYENKKRSARRGAQFVPIGMLITCWKSLPLNSTNMLSIRNSRILITCSSVWHVLPFCSQLTKYALWNNFYIPYATCTIFTLKSIMNYFF